MWQLCKALLLEVCPTSFQFWASITTCTVQPIYTIGQGAAQLLMILETVTERDISATDR